MPTAIELFAYKQSRPNRDGRKCRPQSNCLHTNNLARSMVIVDCLLIANHSMKCRLLCACARSMVIVDCLLIANHSMKCRLLCACARSMVIADCLLIANHSMKCRLLCACARSMVIVDCLLSANHSMKCRLLCACARLRWGSDGNDGKNMSEKLGTFIVGCR